MTHSLKFLLSTALLVSSIPASADAGAILIADNRNIEASARAISWNYDSDGDSAYPPASFAPFSDNVSAHASVSSASSDAFATQTSAVSTSLFSGSGGVSLDSTAGSAFGHTESEANADSFFNVWFKLLEPHTFNLTGALSALATSSGGGSIPSSQSSFSLGSLGGPVSFGFTANAASPPSTQSVAHSGILPAGDYFFFAGSWGGVGADTFLGTLNHTASAGYAFRFELAPAATPVPDPASVLLLVGVSAAFLGGVRKLTQT